jgi:protein O-GlcNAc transferase
LAPSSWHEEYRRGRDLFRSGCMYDAIEAFNRSIRMNPNTIDPIHDLGVVLFHSGQFESAFACFKKVIMLNNRIASAWVNGGNTLCALKRYKDAISWLLNALKLSPNDSTIHFYLAKNYKKLSLSSDAIRHYCRALDVNPGFPEAYNNLGTLLLKIGHSGQALSCFRKALALKEDFANAAFNIGLTLNRLGKIGEASEFIERKLKLNPDHGDALALMVSIRQQLCDWSGLENIRSRLMQKTQLQLHKSQRPSESPFLSFTLYTDPGHNLKVSKAWSQWLLNQQEACVQNFDLRQRRCKKHVLTIGYLSERFRNAATGQLICRLFERHDRERFRVVAYSWGADDGSYYRKKIEQGVDSFIDIRNVSDMQAAQRIFDDNVDILIDLMGWMHGNRLSILALRPAPVQVTYLGYPGTTGAPFIDYILADRIVIPPEHRNAYSEKIAYLPDCYQVNDPETPVQRESLTKSECGLPANGFVFCSFSNDYKIEPNLFDIWMAILKSVPESVLWLLIRAPEACRNLRLEAARRNVDPQRLIFAEPWPKARHLARLKLADLALDTITVNGHTTATDALISGVPFVTVEGSHFASRVGSSILHAVGLDELVTYNLSDYEKTATQLALDMSRIKALKAKLEMNKKYYPLFNVDRFVRNLENTYTHIWDNHLDECR